MPQKAATHCREPRHCQIWQLAWPMMLSNLSIPLLGAVDTAILGHLDRAVYLGAVSLGASVISLLFWSFGFLRMGTTSVAARAVGGDRDDDVRLVLAQSLLLALALALILLACGPALIPLTIDWMGAGEEVAALAAGYGQIRLWGAPAALMNFALVGWFIGCQDTRRPLVLLATTNGLNILLDALLILGLGLNSDGAAWASVSAEYGGLLTGLWLVRRSLGRRGGRLDRRQLARTAAYRALLTVNRHLFVRTLCLLGVFVFFAAQGARLGDTVLAANAVLLQFLMLTSYALDGFAHAAEALTGRCIGAGRVRAFHTAVRRTGLWALTCALLITLVFALGAPWWPRLFTGLAPVLELVSAHYVWICLVPLAGVWGYHLDGVFLGSGQTVWMQYSVLLATGLIFLPTWWLTRDWGNHGLWLAFVIFNGARGVLLAVAYAHLSRRRRWLDAKA